MIYNCKLLAIFCGFTAQFVLDLVGKPKDRFSHVAAHIRLKQTCSASRDRYRLGSDEKTLNFAYLKKKLETPFFKLYHYLLPWKRVVGSGFELIQAFMLVLIACKYEKDQMKNSRENVMTSFSPL